MYQCELLMLDFKKKRDESQDDKTVAIQYGACVEDILQFTADWEPVKVHCFVFCCDT